MNLHYYDSEGYYLTTKANLPEGFTLPNTTKIAPPQISDTSREVKFSETLKVWTVVNARVKYPTSVAAWAAKSMLDLQGYTDKVVEELNSLEDPNKTVAKRLWECATTFQVSDPLVQSMKAAFGWSDSDLGQIFQSAKALEPR